MDMESNSLLAVRRRFFVENNQLSVEKTDESFASPNISGDLEPKKPTKVLFILFG